MNSFDNKWLITPELAPNSARNNTSQLKKVTVVMGGSKPIPGQLPYVDGSRRCIRFYGPILIYKDPRDDLLVGKGSVFFWGGQL